MDTACKGMYLHFRVIWPHIPVQITQKRQSRRKTLRLCADDAEMTAMTD